MILYDAPHLARCYAVRLLAGCLGLKPAIIPMDVYPGRDHQAEAFLAINPLGTLPVLTDAGRVLTDWQEILVWLAQAHGRKWYPAHDSALTWWLGLARDLDASAGQARMIDTFGAPGDAAAARASAEPLLDEAERRVWFGERSGYHWLVPGPHPSIADIACFTGIAPCEDGGLSMRDRPALRRWCDRIRFLDGFVAMGGIFPPMAGATIGPVITG